MSDGPGDADDESEPSLGSSPVSEPAKLTAQSQPSVGRLRARRNRHKEKRAAQSKARRRTVRVLQAFVLLVVIVVGSTVGYLYYQLHQIARVTVKVTPVAKGGVEDILLVGSTSRCAVKPSKSFENFVQQCEQGVNGVNSDVIMILRLVPGKTPMLLSIPRDTFVPNARSGGLSNKIDAALANGPSQLVQAIEQDFGIPINHYVVLNFQTFANIVNALGGITMYFPSELLDTQSGLHISRRGCQHISGLEALALVRARHVYYHYDSATGQWRDYDGTGDLGRIERVHIFLKVLAAEVSSRGLDNPVTDNALLSAIAPDLTLDSTFTTTEILRLILDYHAKIGAAQELTLPIVEDQNTYQYKGYNYGLVVFPAQPMDQQTVDEFLANKVAHLSNASISVAVASASETPSLATSVASSLSAAGYRVSTAPAITAVGPVAETTVEYAGAKHLAQAEQVLASLSGLATLAEVPSLVGADVQINVGSNVAVDAAATTTKNITATSSASGSVVQALLDAMILETASSSSAFSAPTSSSPSISPWDPRACPMKKH